MLPDHKMFVFDYNSFQAELSLVLEKALQSGRTGRLESWIDAHAPRVHDPIDGEPLGERWRDYLGETDVQEFGDFALTVFYTPSRFHGLRIEYGPTREKLLKKGLSEEDWSRAVLGSPIGPDGRRFDPGRMGTFLQAPEQIEASLAVLEPLGDAALEPVIDGLQRARDHGLGAYITL